MLAVFALHGSCSERNAPQPKTKKAVRSVSSEFLAATLLLVSANRSGMILRCGLHPEILSESLKTVFGEAVCLSDNQEFSSVDGV